MLKSLKNKIKKSCAYWVIKRSGLFDCQYYLQNNLDVARSCTDPIKHYIRHGWREGRNPCEYFDTQWYINTYPDVDEVKVNPLCHYLHLGWKEGRDPSPKFSTQNYLNMNPDVASLNINPLVHYLRREGNRGRLKCPIATGISLESDLYKSNYQDNLDFSKHTSDIKAIAFYLPQFHQIPENDRWWGEGFTEWTNTQNAEPLFEGHYQPREPHNDIGYYDLSDISTLKKQATLARQHGIHAFCFYHYWFSGKRLLEKPVNMFLEHPEIDINFCVCWANENWTRTWDGLKKNVLISQAYSPEDDIAFIRDLSRYLRDPRYIRVNGKPVVMIYRPLLLPDPKKTFDRWRQFCRKNKIGEISIWGIRGCFNEDAGLGLDDVMDAEVEFPPNLMAPLYELPRSQIKNNQLKTPAYSYKALVESITSGNAVSERLPCPVYRTSMLAWDNTARRGESGYVFGEFSLSDYYKWLRYNVEYTRKRFSENERFIFVNAWNEWAEGTYLEPDRKYGYANLNTTSRALFDLPYRMSIAELTRSTGLVAPPMNISKVAVHAHIFYSDMIEEFIGYLNNIPCDYDCYITTDTNTKKQEIETQINGRISACNVEIRITPNIGRDVAPFLVGCRDMFDCYDYICHLHTKKSLHNGLGDQWRTYLLEHLLGSKETVRGILNCFSENPHVGLVYPSIFPPVKHCVEWGSNRQYAEWLAKRIGMGSQLPDTPTFPAGTMVWMRKAAFKNLFTAGLSYGDFGEETGQIDGTLAHCVERMLVYIASHNGYSSTTIYKG